MYNVTRTSRRTGKSEQITVDEARMSLEPEYHSWGTVDRCMEDGEEFELRSLRFYYHFVPSNTEEED